MFVQYTQDDHRQKKVQIKPGLNSGSSNICIWRVRIPTRITDTYRLDLRGRYFIPTVSFVIIIILWQTRPFPLESFLRHISGDSENPVYFQSRELILGRPEPEKQELIP